LARLNAHGGDAMNSTQRDLIEAAKVAVFAEAARIRKDTLRPQEDIIASMSDLLEKLEVFETEFVNESGVEDED
jgi:hypothetical protein